MANLLAAPFNSLLSQRVENRIRGRGVGEGLEPSLSLGLITRTVWSEVRKILYQTKWLVLLIILSIIPIVNLLAPIAWIYFGARMLSVEYIEYPMANKGLFFRQVKQSIKKDRFASVGFGLGVMLITLIPVVNFFAMPVAVAAATAYWVDRLDQYAD